MNNFFILSSPVAHDLKNPLGVILGRTEMLRDFLNADPVKVDMVEAQIAHVRESSERLIEMVETLLSDAMTDALDISIRLAPMDLSLLVKEVVDATRPLADKKQQTVAVAAPEKLTVYGDFDRLREAVDNLVSNATKYTPSGGRIELSVARSSKEASITVRDNGLGLSPEDLSRLFGRFQRLSAKPTAGESSTGLGLSIVKRIIELHGGRVAAESAGPNRGTTFTIWLPLVQTSRSA